MPENSNQSRGKRGELAAKHFLKEAGFDILKMNYRCKAGEIDIVAKKDGTYSFVEVKTRRNEFFGNPYEAVNRKKQYKLSQVAAWYLNEFKLGDVPVSFDIVSIIWDDGSDKPQIEFIENAFDSVLG